MPMMRQIIGIAQKKHIQQQNTSPKNVSAASLPFDLLVEFVEDS